MTTRRPTLSIAKRELRGVWRERSIFAAILVQLAVAGFSAFLAVGLLGLYDPEHAGTRVHSRIAYVGDGGFERYLQSAGNLDVATMDAQPAYAAFLDGRVGAIVQETARADGTHLVTLLVPTGSLQGTLLVTQMRGLLVQYQTDLREAHQQDLAQQVVTLSATPTGAVLPFGFVYGLLLPLLVLIPSFLSGSWASDNLVSEVQHKTLLLLRSAPVSPAQLLWGKVLVPLFLAPAQVALWSLLLTANGIPIPGVGWLMLLALAWSGVLVAIGLAIAVSARRQAAAQSAFALVVIVLSVASVLFPRDPFNLVALFGSGAADVAAFVALALWIVLAAVALLVSVAWAGRRLERIMAG